MGITLRTTKGSKLTIQELDGNFTYLDEKTTSIKPVIKAIDPTPNDNISMGYPLNKHWVNSTSGVEFIHKTNGNWVKILTNDQLSTSFIETVPGKPADATVIKTLNDEIYNIIISNSNDYLLIKNDDEIVKLSTSNYNKFIIDYEISSKNLTINNNSTLLFSSRGRLVNCNVVANNLYIDSNPSQISILYETTFVNKLINSEIYPEWFGSTNVGYNWGLAIQSSIDLAFLSGAIVALSSKSYSITTTVTVKAGVTIQGISNGENVFSAGPVKGTILRYDGADDTSAIEVKGRFVKLRDFAVIGDSRFAGNVNGIYLNAVGDGLDNTYLLENLELENIVIHSCKTGLLLQAGNNGAITYSQFTNIRIRDCRNHLIINSLGSRPEYANIGSNGLPFTSDSAFINSNHWNGLFCSGYAEKVLHITSQKKIQQINSQDIFVPANDLSFDHVVIEPPVSKFGYIRLEGDAQVVMRNVRIEALQQDANYDYIPVVYLGEDVHDCLIDTNQQSVPIVDFGYNNVFKSTGSKSSQVEPNSFNLYENSELNGLGEFDFGGTMIYRLPGWSIEEMYADGVNDFDWRPLRVGSSVTITYSNTPRRYGFKAIKIVVPPKYRVRIHQNIDRAQNLLSTVKVNAYVIANNIKDVSFTYQDQVTPIVSSGYSFGDDMFIGEYEPVGGRFTVTKPEIASFYRIALFCQNLNNIGGDNIVFTFTEPQFVKGSELRENSSRPLLESGGLINGVLRYNTVAGIKPISNPGIFTENNTSGHLSLPLEGVMFGMEETGYSITRINYTLKRFPRGSVITLIFKESGIGLINSNLLKITKPFISEAGSTITLLSRDGDGTWEELYRYSKKESGYITAEISTLMSTNTMILPNSGDKMFGLSNVSDTNVVIQRINDSVSNRFVGDTKIMIRFTSPNGKVQLVNSGFINLSTTSNFTPIDGDWIEFTTIGDGTWIETGRKPVISNIEYYPIGTISGDISTFMSGNILNLSSVTTNIYSLTNTVSSQTITRINDTNRFKAGSLLLLEFNNITNGLTINNNNNPYITLTKTGNYTPSTGDWILLYTKGDGTWREISRKMSQAIEQTKGITTLNYSSIVSSSIITLPLTGENYYRINADTGGTITRINELAGTRMTPGTIITIKFINVTSAITIVHSGYLILKDAVNYAPTSNKLIRFITEGNGVWEEIGRT